MNSQTVSLAEAAARLQVDPEQVLAWDMVVLRGAGRMAKVPAWCADARIARVIPILSQVFQGEALEYCLTHVRGFGHGRNGIEALRDGDWVLVLDRLQTWRRQYDRQMKKGNAGDHRPFDLVARLIC